MGDNLVTIAYFQEASEADCYRAILETEGIESVVMGELKSLRWYGADDWIRLQVREPDVSRAKEVLSRSRTASADSTNSA